MDKKELIEQIISIIEKVDNVDVLTDMKDLINGVYKHYLSGKWGR